MENIQLEDDTEIVSLLTNSIFFKEIQIDIIKKIIPSFKVIHLKKGEPLFIAKELSNHIYFVKSGKLEIVRYNERNASLLQIKTCSKGDYLSEFSVLARSSHTTSCFALELSELFIIDNDSFIEILTKYPVITKNIVETLAQLNQQLMNKSNYIEYFKESMLHFKPEMVKILPKELHLTHKVLPVNFENGILSVATLDPNNDLFFKVFYSLNPTIRLKLFRINPDDFKRICNLLIHSYSTGIGHNNPPKFAGDKKVVRRNTAKTVAELLQYSSFFSLITDKYKQYLGKHFKLVEYPAHSRIFSPNTASDKFYIILDGQVELSKKLSGNVTRHVTTLENNDCFGEISLLTNSQHSLQATALTTTQIFTLDKDKFEVLLDRPNFLIELARALADRLQKINNITQVKYYKKSIVSKDIVTSGLLPKSVILNHKVVPLELNDKELILGLVNPDNDWVYVVINRYLSEYQIKIEIITEKLFQDASVFLDSNRTSFKKEKTFNQINKIDIPQNISPGEYLKHIILNGDKHRVSDIHIEPRSKNIDIRYRIDGVLQNLHEKIDLEFGTQLINNIKVIGKLDITDKRYPQDGQIQISVQSTVIKARVSTIPTKFGEKVVLRLIKSKKSVIPLKAIIPNRLAIKFLQDVIAFKQGVFLVTGPTGSGKTSTLYSLLNEINDIKKNIITVEDPIELTLPGINQIEVSDKINLTFSKILKHILRQDPDIIMIGEIRDAQSAQIAFEAALTGHLVLSTLHTNSSLEVVARLVELGVESSAIATGLIGTMAQRLIPTICDNCKVKRESTESEKNFIKKTLDINNPPVYLFHGEGCLQCNYKGTLGRIPIFEYWKKNLEIRDQILQNSDLNILNKIVLKNGFQSMEQFGIQLALLGLVTIEHVQEYVHGL